MRNPLAPLVVVVLALLSVVAPVGSAMDGAPPAGIVIADYLKCPFPADDRLGDARTVRLATLDRLKLSRDDAVVAIAAAMPTVKDARQRAELVEALRFFPTKASADLCVAALGDASAEVRGQAIGRLWLLSRRADKVSDRRERTRADLAAPPIEGLVPHLLKAADDAAPTNRTTALYALADTLDRAAIERLRKGLKDGDANVRFIAATLLSEFDDASGMGELKAELARLREGRGKDQMGMRFLHTGRLIASFERLTGKSFGKAPMNPMLMSDLRKAAQSEAEHDRLLDAWAAWWDWQPAPAAAK
jgi:hypothetical protein